jgi:hypothetical protein
VSVELPAAITMIRWNSVSASARTPRIACLDSAGGRL